MDYLENTVLAQNRYIGGDALSLADIHAIWGVRWDLHGAESHPPGLGAGHEPAVDRKQFPKVWSLIDRLPIPQPKIISFEEAKAKIFEAGYSADVGGVWDLEPTGIEAGANVTVDALG